MAARNLIEPSFLFDGARAWVYVGHSEDGLSSIWRRGIVTCAAGNHARVAVKDSEGAVVEVWRSLHALRIDEAEDLKAS